MLSATINQSSRLITDELYSNEHFEVIDKKDFTAEFLKMHISGLLEKSELAPIQGDGADLQAAEKIVALAEFAMKA